MQDVDDLEKRGLQAVQELRAAAGVRLEYEHISPSASTPEEVDTALRDLDANGQLHMESSLRHPFFVRREIHVMWLSEDHPALGGEFHLHSTIDSAGHPEYVPEDVNLNSSHQRILCELRAIDSVSHLGIGAVAGVRLAAEPPLEMWYYCNTQHTFQKLDIGPVSTWKPCW